MSTAKYCESAPQLSWLGTTVVTSGTGGARISGHRPFPATAYRMFMSPILSQTALWTMRGPNYRGRGLDTYSLEAVPQAVKVRGIQPEEM